MPGEVHCHLKAEFSVGDIFGHQKLLRQQSPNLEAAPIKNSSAKSSFQYQRAGIEKNVPLSEH